MCTVLRVIDITQSMPVHAAWRSLLASQSYNRGTGPLQPASGEIRRPIGEPPIIRYIKFMSKVC